MQNIGKVLRIVRMANNMSRKEASEATNVSAIYISELETGKKNHITETCLAKLAKGYGLRLEQLIKLEEYYTNLLIGEDCKYRRTLIKTLVMLENNCQLRLAPKLSRKQVQSLILLAENAEVADKIIEQYLGAISYREKIAFITGMFDIPEIVDRQEKDTDEQTYFILLTHIVKNI